MNIKEKNTDFNFFNSFKLKNGILYYSNGGKSLYCFGFGKIILNKENILLFGYNRLYNDHFTLIESKIDKDEMVIIEQNGNYLNIKTLFNTYHTVLSIASIISSIFLGNRLYKDLSKGNFRINWKTIFPKRFF